MNRIANIALLILAITTMGTGFYIITRLPKNTEVRYNCELAEISPDFPAEVRKQCRELKAKK